MIRLLVAVSLAGLLLFASACGGKVETPLSPTVAAAAGTCQLALEPNAQSVPSSGGNFYTAVSGPCPWTASSDAAWITVTDGQGAPVGSVTYHVVANPNTAAREGRLRIGEAVLTVSQTACRVSLHIGEQSVPAGGGSFELDVDAESQCAWSATATDGWVSLRTTNGTGRQTIAFVVAPNTGRSSRRATILVGDRTVSVEQAGVPEEPGP